MTEHECASCGTVLRDLPGSTCRAWCAACSGARSDAPEDVILGVIRRVAARLRVPAGRVRVSFAVYSEEDGGPAWSIEATRPARDKRKVAEPFHGGGSTLAEAEADFLGAVDRRENPPPAKLPPDLQAILDAALAAKAGA